MQQQAQHDAMFAGLGGGAAMHRSGSMPMPVPMPASAPVSLALAAAAAAGGMSMPIPSAALPTSLPVPTIVSMPAPAVQQQQQQLMMTSAPAAGLRTVPSMAALATAGMAPMGAMQPSVGMTDAAAAAVAAQQQAQALAAGVQPAPQVMVSMPMQLGTGLAGQQVLLHGVGSGMHGGGSSLQPLAQPTTTQLSGGALTAAAAQAKPTLTGISEAVSGEMGAAPMPSLMPAAQSQLSGPASEAAPAAAVADQAAQNLNQQAQHLTAQASMHGQAKTNATSQAQQLASQAQLHAQASVQAAVQAEQLKQTLAGERRQGSGCWKHVACMCCLPAAGQPGHSSLHSTPHSHISSPTRLPYRRS